MHYAMVVAAETAVAEVAALVVAAVMVVAAVVLLLVVEESHGTILGLKIARFCRFLKRRNGHTDIWTHLKRRLCYGLTSFDPNLSHGITDRSKKP